MPNIRRTLLSAAAAASLVACSSSAATAPVETSLEQQKWATSLGIDLSTMTRLSSGVYVKDVTVGTGATVQATSTLTVFYTGWLASGKVFDTNVGGTAVQFALSGLIEGWKSGLPGMQVGGKRRLVIPSSLGYGPSGYGPIPAYANLVFDVQVVSIP
jgi:peptidylprolyl isomerase